jgi:hypothetical protein
MGFSLSSLALSASSLSLGSVAAHAFFSVRRVLVVADFHARPFVIGCDVLFLRSVHVLLLYFVRHYEIDQRLLPPLTPCCIDYLNYKYVMFYFLHI